MNYDDNRDIPTGYTFKPTDEELIEFVVQLNDGKGIYPDRVERTDLFDRHPAVIIRNLNLHPCMRDIRNYYLFYCKVPDNTSYDRFGYHRIDDGVKGVWEATGYSSIISCNLSDGKAQLGEVQTFSYKPLSQTTSLWRLVMYGLPDPESNMVICKVFETADSKTAEAVRSAINAEKDLEETLNMAAAQARKIELLEAALQEERRKNYDCRDAIRDKTRLLAEKVIDRNDAEHEEADVIEPTNRGRKRKRGARRAHVRQRAQRVAREYLNIRRKKDTHTQRASISSSTNKLRWTRHRIRMVSRLVSLPKKKATN